LQDRISALLPNDRVSWCLKHRQTTSGNIQIVYSEEKKRAYYGNLLACGSVWVCPICSAKITEQRRLELSEAIDRWQAAGGSVFMGAFTLQHTVEDDLKELKRSLNDSFRALAAGREYKRIKDQFQIVGSVSSLEVTWSMNNGWHPHKHTLYFSKVKLSDQDIYNLQNVLSGRWQSVLEKRGRYSNEQAGVKITTGEADQIKNYCFKWGLSHEIAKSPVKTGRNGGLSPFELADMSSTDKRAGHLFKEYAKAFKGSKQLTYSRGLKKLLDIQDKPDQETAEELQNEVILLAELDMSAWKRVVIQGMRGIVLEAAAGGSIDILGEYLEKIGIERQGETDNGIIVFRSRSP